MNVEVYEANVDADEKILITTLHKYLTPLSNAGRFDWLYRKNPHGRGRAWIVREVVSGTVIGVASAFPRVMNGCGHELSGWVLGDFCVAPQFRTLGPALQLQKVFVQAVDSGTIPFFYDFPSASMMAVLRRLGVESAGEMIRLAKPLRVDRKVRNAVKHPALSRTISALGNRLLELRRFRRTKVQSWDIGLHWGNCSEEFSRLAAEVGGAYGMTVQRTAAYLNWRYLANPLAVHQLVTARSEANLLAYAVLTQDGEDATLVDLFGMPEPRVMAALIDWCAEYLYLKGVITIHAPILGSHPWEALLGQQGFRRRNASPFIAHQSPELQAWKKQHGEVKWSLTHGDRDS